MIDSDSELKVALASVDTIAAAADGAQPDIVTAALLNHGAAFVVAVDMRFAQDKELYSPIKRITWERVSEWLRGEKLSERADEDERRARFALFLAKRFPQLSRLAANSVFMLPSDHELHDPDTIKEALLSLIRASSSKALTDPDPNEQMMGVAQALDGITGLVQHKLLPRDQLLVWIKNGDNAERAVRTPDRGRVFRRIAALYLLAEVQENNEARTGLLRRAREVLEPALEASEVGRETELVAAVLDHIESEGSSSALGSLLDLTTGPGDEINAFVTIQQTKLAYSEGKFEQVTAKLAPLIPIFENHYLTALTKAEVDRSAELFTDSTVRLAFAHAQLGHWEQALQFLDRVKSRRFRHRTALRAHPSGSQIIDLEAALLHLVRGVAPQVALPGDVEADPIGARLTLRSRLLEAYRAVRDTQGTQQLKDPDAAELADSLEPGAALAALGIAPYGAMVILVRSGHEPQGVVLPGPAAQELLDATVKGDWLVALGAPGIGVEAPQALIDALEVVERALGAVIVGMLDPSVTKLVVVPHQVLHLLPFWALPSFVDLNVTMAPSVSHVLAWHGTGVAEQAKAVVVGNPTGDLTIAAAEAVVVAGHFTDAGYTVRLLPGADATEEALIAVTPGAAVLHFSGHGKADMLRSDFSALEVHPHLADVPVKADDPLESLAAAATWQPFVDNERWADTPAGRLWEQVGPVSGRIRRRLELSRPGTLAGIYEWVVEDAKPLSDDQVVSELARLLKWDPERIRALLPSPLVGKLAEKVRDQPVIDHRQEVLEQAGRERRPLTGRLLRLAELWTVGDILARRALEGCVLAFLSSCEAALGELNPFADEYAGLPAAMHLAGVETVIAPLWPVDAGLAAIFADLFYEELCAGLNGSDVDAAAIVDRCRYRLRCMECADVADRFQRLAAAAPDRIAKIILEARAHKMRKSHGSPFAHPFDWAAFHAIGRSKLHLPATSTLAADTKLHLPSLH